MLVGPPLILTSVVLACGLGWLSAFAMLAALAADLLILRPTVTLLSRLARQIGGKRLNRLEPGH